MRINIAWILIVLGLGAACLVSWGAWILTNDGVVLIAAIVVIIACGIFGVMAVRHTTALKRKGTKAKGQTLA